MSRALYLCCIMYPQIAHFRAHNRVRKVRETNTGESSGAARGRSSEVSYNFSAFPTTLTTKTAMMLPMMLLSKKDDLQGLQKRKPAAVTPRCSRCTGTKSKWALLDPSLILSFTAELITKWCKSLEHMWQTLSLFLTARRGLQLLEAGHPRVP